MHLVVQSSESPIRNIRQIFLLFVIIWFDEASDSVCVVGLSTEVE